MEVLESLCFGYLDQNRWNIWSSDGGVVWAELGGVALVKDTCLEMGSEASHAS